MKKVRVVGEEEERELNRNKSGGKWRKPILETRRENICK